MDIFKQATKEQWRFQTKVGNLSTEQLWQLSPENLNDLAVSLDAEYKKSGKKSFLTISSGKDKTIKSKFELVIEVLDTIMEERQAATNALEIKQHNQKILGLIAEKNDESLKGKSVKELEGMLR